MFADVLCLVGMLICLFGFLHCCWLAWLVVFDLGFAWFTCCLTWFELLDYSDSWWFCLLADLPWFVAYLLICHWFSFA